MVWLEENKQEADRKVGLSANGAAAAEIHSEIVQQVGEQQSGGALSPRVVILANTRCRVGGGGYGRG